MVMIVATALTTSPRMAQAASADEDAGATYGEGSDPLEGLNRVLFTIHDGIDIVALRPISIVYNAVLPTIARNSVRNFLSHIASPITLLNDLLQGDLLRAENTIVRFFLNTIGGYGGLDDIASRMGHDAHYEDFGQTLAVWGIGSGPYVFIPLIGPVTLRHGVGRLVDIVASPWTWLLYQEPLPIAVIPAGITLLSARAENVEALDNLRETSPDYYASIRNLYFQNRNYEISNGENLDELEDIPH